MAVETEELDEFVLNARYGDLECIREMLVQIPNKRDLITNFNQKNQQAIFCASANGHLEVLDELLKHIEKEDLLLTNSEGNTCLHWACLNGQLEIVKRLLEFAPEDLALLRNKSGFSAATLAESRGFMEIVKILIGSYEPEDIEEQEDFTVTNDDAEYKELLSNKEL